MSQRIIPVFLLAGLLAACGGNPFVDAPVEPVPVNPVDPPGLPTDFLEREAVSGAVESAGLQPWTPGAGVIQVAMDAQVLPGLSGNFVADPAFDVTSGGVTYYGYVLSTSTQNRRAVVLVRGSGAAKAMVAMEPGQFANGSPDMYHAGGATYRADVFSKPAGGGLFNYTGSYAGLLNTGTAAGTPPGSLAPTEPYRTSGTTLITADFTRMKMSGGVTGRKIEDTGAALPDVALWTTDISTTGDFSGVVYRGNNPPPVGQAVSQGWGAAGRYEGIFSKAGRDVAVIMLFEPLAGVWEQGTIVGSCTLNSAGTCP